MCVNVRRQKRVGGNQLLSCKQATKKERFFRIKPGCALKRWPEIRYTIHQYSKGRPIPVTGINIVRVGQYW